MTTLSIGIAGAGLLGRLLAWQLSRAGHRISVFDAAQGPDPVFRSQAGQPYVPTAAGFTAAGMLSPLAELDTVEPAVAALGWRSITLWQSITAALPQRPMFRCAGSLMLAHRSDLGAAQRVLQRLQTACTTPEWQASSPAEGVQPLPLADLHRLEPALQGPAHAWLLPGEAQIDTVATLMALYADSHCTRYPVQWHWQRPVQHVSEDGHLHFSDGSPAAAFDAVVDVRGTGAAASKNIHSLHHSSCAAGNAPMQPNADTISGLQAHGASAREQAAPGPDANDARPNGPTSSGFDVSGQNAGKHASPIFDVRGVRGEVIWLQAPAHGLTRCTRLLHSRHAVYIVPRSPDLILVGASELETEDRSPASLRSVVELLAAAHSTMPALAEARILRLDVNLRPALPDNNPHTEWRSQCLRINGLFRHGWLLAPALAEQALARTGWLAA